MSKDIHLGTIELTGAKAVILLVCLVGFMGFRMFGTHDVTHDKELKRALALEIESEISRNMLPSLQEAVAEHDEEMAEELTDELVGSKVNFHGIFASEPVIGMVSGKNFVAKVEYSLQGNPSKRFTRYFSVERSGFSGWYIRRETGSFGFILAKF